MIDEYDKKQMQMVLEGKDINVSLPGELGEHYLEENWTRYTLEEQTMIRKWIRFMFSKSKNINYKRTSYGLKHSCEEDVGFYVHNDAIKKAFLLEGFVAVTGRINWYFNTKNKVTVEKSEKFKQLFQEELKGKQVEIKDFK